MLTKSQQFEGALNTLVATAKVKPKHNLKRRKFSVAAKTAIRAYYDDRKTYNEIIANGGSSEDALAAWDKQATLDAIKDATCGKRGSGIRRFTACAGTFWFGWSDGVVTEHDESNWWRMKKKLK